MNHQKEKLRNHIYNNNKRKKNLGMNLNKDMKDLHTKNVIAEETEDKKKKKKKKLCSWMGRIRSAKMSILPQRIYTFNAIPTKISEAFFTETEQTIPTFLWKHKGPQTAKGILRKDNSSWRKLAP